MMIDLGPRVTVVLGFEPTLLGFHKFPGHAALVVCGLYVAASWSKHADLKPKEGPMICESCGREMKAIEREVQGKKYETHVCTYDACPDHDEVD